MDPQAETGPTYAEQAEFNERGRWEDMVATLAKPGADILATLTPEKVHMLHMVIGIAGEAGELLDAVKKYVIYNKPLDEELLKNILEEFGDLAFYVEGLRTTPCLNFQPLDWMRANYSKLGKRYEGLKYSDAAAHARADKVETGETDNGVLAQEAVRKSIAEFGANDVMFAMASNLPDALKWQWMLGPHPVKERLLELVEDVADIPDCAVICSVTSSGHVSPIYMRDMQNLGWQLYNEATYVPF